jgi:hypothetical protein
MNFLRRLFFFLSLLAQVVLAVSPFVPWVRENIWSAQTSVNGFASTLATYIGVEFACLGTMVVLFLFDIEQQGKNSTEQFRDLLHQYTPLQVRCLKSSDFYKEFLGHCAKAKNYVKICYFARTPPDRGAPEDRKRYYLKILTVMKDNHEAVFKRIIRDTDANRQWASEVVSYFAGATNFSLALLKDTESDDEMSLALSVQVVDDCNAWLVAISEHSDSSAYRDVAIENEILTEVLNKYFDRLWGLSRVVFKPGDSIEHAHRLIFEEK